MFVDNSELFLVQLYQTNGNLSPGFGPNILAELSMNMPNGGAFFSPSFADITGIPNSKEFFIFPDPIPLGLHQR